MIVIVSFFILSYKLPESFIFHPDFARDMFDITRISQGKPMLIGPKLTFGGIYSGPYYYYLLLPILFLSKYNITAVLLFNALLFSVALGFFYYQLSQKFTGFGSLLATVVLLFSPLYLIASRNPSNAFTYLPFLLVLLMILYCYTIQKPKLLFLLGLFGGIIATFHAVTGVVIIFVSILVLLDLRYKKNFLWYIVGFIAAFSPLFLFEIKHHFIMLKNTFIDKSYLLWINNKNIPGGIVGKKNPFENFLFIAHIMKKFMVVSPLVLLFVAGVVSINKSLSQKEKLLLSLSFGSVVFLALFMRFQLIYHYLFATVLLLLFTVVVILTKHKQYILLLLLLAIELANIPQEIYLKTWRSDKTYEQAVHVVIDQKLLHKTDSFNIIQVTEPDLLSPNGFEYRFFLQQYGYKPASEFAYKTSRKLLLFSEKPDYNIKNLDTWESREFGREHIAKSKKYTSGTITIYVAEK